MEPTSNDKNTKKVILIGSILPQEQKRRFTHPLMELQRLVETAEMKVLGTLIQSRREEHGGTYLGKGKLQELKAMIAELQPNWIVTDDDLKPAQLKKLEEILEIPIMDRTEVILEIFSAHAQSHEAKLQVELAKLQYSLPRLRRMWVHLDRYSGGTGGGKAGGIGPRGPGEKQIESDRRMIKKRIGVLLKEIERIKKRKESEVQSRNEEWFSVGLVGYTNVGKSTLLNALTGANVLVEDRLFSTLDTRTRLWNLGQGQKVLLSDTVGFIEKLPHHLVASFKATLEEARQCDVLLHVSDVSNPDAKIQIEVVEKVLKEIGVTDRPTIMVFNKVDMLEDKADLAYLQGLFPNSLPISATKKIGLDSLQEKVLQLLDASSVEMKVEIPISEGKLLSWIEARGRILQKSSDENAIHYVVKIPKTRIHWLSERVKNTGGNVSQL